MTQATSQKILNDILRDLKENSVAKYRSTINRFFKEETNFLGTKMGEVKSVSQKHFQDVKELPKKDIYALCEQLLSHNDERQFVAFDWAYRIRKQYEKKDFPIFERWLTKYVENWAACDTFCTKALGEYLVQFPEYVPRTKIWARSKNRWLRRGSAVVFIYTHRRGLYEEEAFTIADILLEDEDDMVQKGYGWMLKEISNRNQKRVFDYAMEHKDKMSRTALRYAIEKMPPAKKKQAMAK